MTVKRAFTLIELLIVVAIIAILAAVALPNLLEAQMRSRVTRMIADMRSIATAAEMYFTDHGVYPPHRNGDGTEIGYPDRYVPFTTPIAYMTSIPTTEVFFTKEITGQGGSLRWVSWTNFSNYPPNHALAPHADLHRYMLRSRGPDGVNEPNDVRNAFFAGGLGAAPTMIYDPSNGTTSRGDIVRTLAFTP